jgi:hypothetical protein
MRDLVILVIRGFAQKFNSTSLNSLLRIEAWKANVHRWGKLFVAGVLFVVCIL